MPWTNTHSQQIDKMCIFYDGTNESDFTSAGLQVFDNGSNKYISDYGYRQIDNVFGLYGASLTPLEVNKWHCFEDRGMGVSIMWQNGYVVVDDDGSGKPQGFSNL